MNGIKTINIRCTTRYPIVSAYEFEFLKTEAEIHALLKPCTIYFILQRPLLQFENVRTGNGEIKFNIIDGSTNEPLACSFSPCESGLCTPDEEINIEVQFYKKTPDRKPPFNDVAAIKLFTAQNKFIKWFSPSKFIYEHLSGTIAASIDGEIRKYLDYTVHYIGKAFSQSIWRRLTGHHKMQSILTLENSLGTKALKAPFEISLMMLDVYGYDENNIFPAFDFALDPGVDPIVYNFGEEEGDPRFIDYYSPKLTPRAQELTTEVEAMLIQKFKPAYNDVLFDNYPYIESGTRSAGYTQSTVVIERIPAILRTAHHTQDCVLPNR